MGLQRQSKKPYDRASDRSRGKKQISWDFQRQMHGKSQLISWEMKNDQWKQPILWEFSENWSVLHWFGEHFFNKRRQKFCLFLGKWCMLAYAIITATETLTTKKCCLCKTGDFAGKFEQLIWTIVHVCICLTMRFFLAVIIICSFLKQQCTQEMGQWQRFLHHGHSECPTW